MLTRLKIAKRQAWNEASSHIWERIEGQSRLQSSHTIKDQVSAQVLRPLEDQVKNQLWSHMWVTCID